MIFYVQPTCEQLLGARAKSREKIFASRITNNSYISVLTPHEWQYHQ